MDASNPIQLSTEQLEIIEDMASCLMSPAEIAITVSIEPKRFKHILEYDKQSSLYLAFQKGRIKTKWEIHRMVVKLAQKGSPQAELLAEKYLKEQNSESL